MANESSDGVEVVVVVAVDDWVLASLRSFDFMVIVEGDEHDPQKALGVWFCQWRFWGPVLLMGI